MTSQGGNEKEVQAALSACGRAIGSRRFRDAERHLREAARHGASEAVISRTARKIRNAEKTRAVPDRRGVWLGFAAAFLGYMVLSFQQPANWGEAIWAALAFLLIPALVGFVVNRTQRRDRPPTQAFFSGMKAAGIAMFLYASITLIVLANRVGRPDAVMQEFLAAVIVITVYSLLAGAAAGTVNAALTRLQTGRESDGTAS
jgi:hypothetical protein